MEVVQNFENLRKDRRFIEKIVGISILFMTPILNGFAFLYLILFIEDSLNNRKARLPEFSTISWEALGQNSAPVIVMFIYYLAVCFIQYLPQTSLLSELLLFFLLPSGTFTLVLYLYTQDSRNFFNLQKILEFWRWNWDGLLVPATVLLTAVRLTAKSPYFCFSFFSILALIYMINFVVNRFDEGRYGR